MNTLWGWGRASWAGCGPDVRRGGQTLIMGYSADKSPLIGHLAGPLRRLEPLVAQRQEKCGPNRPTPTGYSCNNAPINRHVVTLTIVATSCYSVNMRSVGIKMLNSRLSEYVRLAASGETVLVTDRDRVVAEIGPPRETRSQILADVRLAEAVRKGWLTPPVLLAGEPPLSAPVAPLRDLLAELEGDRSER